MMYLHVISFDVPFPANYGGVIDVFYKIKTLHQQNVKVILHCYQYGRKEAKELNEICHKVYYYQRNNGLNSFFSLYPFIVKSRNSNVLLQNLLKDNHPILFEGLHSCYLLNEGQLSGRKKIVRTHNIEHHYYQNLGKIETGLLKQIYFYIEAFKLKIFEKKLAPASVIAAISQNDKIYYQQFHPHVELISAFHSNDSLLIIEGKGSYILYHGNMSVGENNQAALFLVNEVFNKIEIPFYIAGNNPSAELVNAAAKHKHIKIHQDCSPGQIDDLIRNAHINILPTFQATGIKLKLLNALFKGRFCLVNSPMVKDTGLEKFCIVKDTAEELIAEIKTIMQNDFSQNEIKNREALLTGDFSNDFNGRKLVEMIEQL